MSDDPRRIDDLDRDIVERLRINGRESNRSLAAAAGVNEATVAARLRRLESERAVHVVALTDMAGFGYEQFSFALVRASGRPVIDVAADIAGIQEVISVNVVTGRYDILCAVLVSERMQLGDVIGETLAAVAGVQVVHCEIAVDVLRYDSEWAALATDGDVVTAVGPPLPTGAVDELDLGIIELLQQDARTSNRSIASALAVSEGTVRVRLKRLEDRHLIRIRAVSDVATFGLTAAAHVGVVARAGHVAAVGEALVAMDGIPVVMRSVGQYSYFLVLLAQSRQQLLELVLNQIQSLEGVASTETLEVAATRKHVYTWARLLEGPPGSRDG